MSGMEMAAHYYIGDTAWVADRMLGLPRNKNPRPWLKEEKGKAVVRDASSPPTKPPSLPPRRV